jgi:hypothetical protein
MTTDDTFDEYWWVPTPEEQAAECNNPNSDPMAKFDVLITSNDQATKLANMTKEIMKQAVNRGFAVLFHFKRDPENIGQVMDCEIIIKVAKLDEE